MDAKRTKPVIVAMKGHPGTGKSTVARAIAADLQCPLLDKDDVYGATFSLYHHLSSPSSSDAGRLVNELSYESLFRLAAAQLCLGLSVVVDSPLSSRSRLDSLLSVAAEDGRGAAVVIVECRPGDEAEWRRRLERRGATGGASWHKPATWRDLERLVESYNGCCEYDAGDVAKLVVDTTAPVGIEEMLSTAMAFIRSHSTIREFY